MYLLAVYPHGYEKDKGKPLSFYSWNISYIYHQMRVHAEKKSTE